MKNPGNNKGVAAVEFAIVLPLLLLIVFGIIEFGFLLYDQAVITNASREGARKGVVYAIEQNASGASTAQDYAASLGTLISLNRASAPTCASGNTNPCATAIDVNGDFASGHKLQVTVYYNFGSFLLDPIIGTKPLSATTVMTYE